MKNRSRASAPLALALLAAPLAAGAQTVRVTLPGVTTIVGSRQSDAPAVDAWLRDNVGGGGSVGISDDYARSGNGSAFMESISSASKADFEYLFGGEFVSPFALGTLTSASFDVYRDASSTAAAHLHPSLRFFVDADGSVATTGDRGYLIYEAVYNGVAAVTEGAWQTFTIGSTANLWFRQFSPGATENVYDRTLAAYQTGYTPTAGFNQITGNSLVYGIGTGVGSGWDGTYTGAVDNIHLRYGADGNVTFNFEVATVPEPTTVALTAGGLALLGAVVARRRRKD
jgi:hypothetical protein